MSCVHDQVEREVFHEELDLVLQALLIQRVQNGMAGAVGRRTGAHRRGLAVILHMAAEGALVNAAILGAGEGHAVMFELNDRGDRLAAHIFDGVLVTQPIRALDGVIHVPAPVILAHIAQGRADAALGGHRVAARGEDFGDAGGFEAGGPHAEGGAQTGAAGAHHHHVIGVVDNSIGARAGLADGVHLNRSDGQKMPTFGLELGWKALT